MADLFEELSRAVAAFSPRRKYLIGVSGGRDSMCLLYALRHLGFDKLVVCHLDHGLRGRAAKADRNAVARLAGKLGLPLEEAGADVAAFAKESGQSIELAARESRYAFFTACARRLRCPRLFLAHHADDQIETVLFNFLRGTGTAGLGGMKPVSDRDGLEIYRPLLGIRRAEITAFAQEHSVPFREDASNIDLRHTRNRLRHEVLPLLAKVMGHPVEPALLRMTKIAQEEEAWMSSQVPPTEATLRTRDLKALPLALQRRLVLRWLREQGVEDAGFEETNRVLSLLDDGPAKINLPGGRHARRRSGVIFLAP